MIRNKVENTFKIYLNGRLYSSSKSSHSLDSLSYFLLLSYYFPHKKFTKDRVSEFVNINTFNRHARQLKKMGLLTYSKGWYKLSSNKQIEEQYGKGKLLYANVSSITEIKRFLQVVPVISNIYSQNKAIENKDNHRKSNEVLERNGFVRNHKAYLKFQKRIESKGLSVEFDNLKLSIKGIMRIAGCSEKTAVKIKEWIKDLGIASFFRVKDKKKVSDLGHLNYLKSEGLLPKYSVFHKGYAYFDKASEVSLKSSFSSFLSFSYTNYAIQGIKTL